MYRVRRGQRLVCMFACASTVAIIVFALRAAHPDSEPLSETTVSQSQLLSILTVPSIQQELGLTEEQIEELREINASPMRLPFAEAMNPIAILLTPEQCRQFKSTAFQGLMVRAFAVMEVRGALELTSAQMTKIAAIQSRLKSQLQPFQDKVNRREVADLFALDHDVATRHEEAYENALEVLTAKQRKIWEGLSKPVPPRKQ